LLCLAVSSPALAEDGASELPAAESETDGQAASAEVEAPVDLETLLRLPDSYRTVSERRGGIEKGEWQARFGEARGNVGAKNADLDRLQEKLSGLASTGGQWQAGAPGLASPDSQHQTLSYKLRQELRGARTAIDEAERGMLELGVQADLAGVPDDWRQ
jgi:hypothetical protein